MFKSCVPSLLLRNNVWHTAHTQSSLLVRYLYNPFQTSGFLVTLLLFLFSSPLLLKFLFIFSTFSFYIRHSWNKFLPQYLFECYGRSEACNAIPLCGSSKTTDFCAHFSIGRLRVRRFLERIMLFIDVSAKKIADVMRDKMSALSKPLKPISIASFSDPNL